MQSVYYPSLTRRSQLDPLLCTTKRWLQPNLLSATYVMEWVAMDRFLWGLPPEEAWSVGMRAPTTTAETVEALECALVMLEISHPATRKKAPPRLAWAALPPMAGLAGCPTTMPKGPTT